MHRPLSHPLSLIGSPLYPDSETPLVGKYGLADDLSDSALDIQMRYVAELEDVHWHTHFSSTSYYVAGRGYDQYKPAFELGWNAALQNPDASLSDFLPRLESLWAERHATSLLPLREVHNAVQEAWVHARMQMQALQQSRPTPMRSHEVAGLIHPLYKNCLSLAGELQRLGSMPVSEFVQQIIERHVQLLHSLARGLMSLDTPDASGRYFVSPWVSKVHNSWARLKTLLNDATPEEFFERCEQRERKLLSAYQTVMGKDLPPDTKDLLHKQAKQLQEHLDKLSWVRKNWSL